MGAGVAGLSAGGGGGSLCGVGVPWGVGRCGSLGGGVCGGCVWVLGRGGEARDAGPGAVCVAECVSATGWGVGREGQGVWGCVRVTCVGIRVRLQWCACVVSCRLRGLEEELAVFHGRGEDFADACAYLVYLLVVGRGYLRAVLRPMCPMEPVDGVLPAD